MIMAIWLLHRRYFHDHVKLFADMTKNPT